MSQKVEMAKLPVDDVMLTMSEWNALVQVVKANDRVGMETLSERYGLSDLQVTALKDIITRTK